MKAFAFTVYQVLEFTVSSATFISEHLVFVTFEPGIFFQEKNNQSVDLFLRKKQDHRTLERDDEFWFSFICRILRSFVQLLKR